jgi:hypothetical protein
VRGLTIGSEQAFLKPLIGVGELAISDHRSNQPTHDALIRVILRCAVSAPNSVTARAAIWSATPSSVPESQSLSKGDTEALRAE